MIGIYDADQVDELIEDKDKRIAELDAENAKLAESNANLKLELNNVKINASYWERVYDDVVNRHQALLAKAEKCGGAE